MRTLNSRTCSTEGATITVLNVNSLLSMPSMSQALAFAWWPSALKFDAPRGLNVLAPERFSPACPGVTPGVRYTNVAKFRPFSGSSLIARSSITVPISDESVFEKRSRADDRRRFLEAAHFEQHVHARPLIDLQDDAVAHPFLEALDAGLDGVGAGNQKRRRIEPAHGIGDERRGSVLVHFAHRDHGARHDAAGVADGTTIVPVVTCASTCGAQTAKVKETAAANRIVRAQSLRIVGLLHPLVCLAIGLNAVTPCPESWNAARVPACRHAVETPWRGLYDGRSITVKQLRPLAQALVGGAGNAARAGSVTVGSPSIDSAPTPAPTRR